MSEGEPFEVHAYACTDTGQTVELAYGIDPATGDVVSFGVGWRAAIDIRSELAEVGECAVWCYPYMVRSRRPAFEVIS